MMSEVFSRSKDTIAVSWLVFMLDRIVSGFQLLLNYGIEFSEDELIAVEQFLLTYMF